MRMNGAVAISAVMLAVPTWAVAAGKAEGGCVVRNTDRDGPAPIYRGEDGDKTEAQAKRGDCFGGITTLGPVHHYQFEHKNNRVHILYLSKGMSFPYTLVDPGNQTTAWMEAADLETFLYDCGCSSDTEKQEECAPTARAGFIKKTWNVCFRDARDRKLGELKARWAQEAGSAVGSEPKPEKGEETKSRPSEKALTNDDVIGMAKAGLGDDIIVAKVQQAPAEALDASTDGLIRLKKEGVSKPVIDAVLRRVSQRK